MNALVIKNSADQSGDGSTIKFLCGQSTNTGAQITAVGRSLDKADLVFTTGSTDAMKIDSNGKVFMTGGLGLTNLPEAGTPSNLYVSPAGTVHLSTATSYTAEEVDKKLAIKDKLIESLTKRLDKLEKRVK